MTDLVIVTAEKATTCSVEAWRAILQQELPNYSEGQINQLVGSLDRKIKDLETEAHERLKNGLPCQEKQNLAREFRSKRREVFTWYHATHPEPPWIP
jgi:hypothetical protein